MFGFRSITVIGDAVVPTVTYAGGKNGACVYQRIINQMPPHDIYIEAFLGSGTIMRKKRPAGRNIGIDRSAQAIDLCRDLSSDLASQLQLIHGDALKLLAPSDLALPSNQTGAESFANLLKSSRTLVYVDPPT